MALKHAQQRHSSTQLPFSDLLHEARQSHANSKSRYLLERDGIGIRLAPQRNDADQVVRLLSRMYSQRGYRIPSFGFEPHERLHQLTLEACYEESTTGTLTITFDTMGRLKAEELYGQEIASFRDRGARVCEFTRLAVDTESNAKQTLAFLFHFAVIFAYRIYRASDLFIEVNPRHTLFYRRKLGFTQIGEERVCPRVDAPAVLLHRSLPDLAQDVRRFGGVRTPENNNFYALWLTHEEENAMVRKIEERLARGRTPTYSLDSFEEPTARLARSA